MTKKSDYNVPGTELSRCELKASSVATSALYGAMGHGIKTMQHFNVFMRITGLEGGRHYPAPEITEKGPANVNRLWYVYRTYKEKQSMETALPQTDAAPLPGLNPQLAGS